jgi:hypothetical protein
MMIVGVWLLQPKIAYKALCERVAEKLLKYERFRQAVVRDPAGAAWWVEDESFDIHHHVVREKLKHDKVQSEREALQARVAELAATPLDPDRPLWQFRLIEGYDGGSALIARVHHCIGDGIALISVMMTITDGGSDPPVRKRRHDRQRRRRSAPTGLRGGASRSAALGQGRRAVEVARLRPRGPGLTRKGDCRLIDGARTAPRCLAT